MEVSFVVLILAVVYLAGHHAATKSSFRKVAGTTTVVPGSLPLAGTGVVELPVAPVKAPEVVKSPAVSASEIHKINLSDDAYAHIHFYREEGVAKRTLWVASKRRSLKPMPIKGAGTGEWFESKIAIIDSTTTECLAILAGSVSTQVVAPEVVDPVIEAAPAVCSVALKTETYVVPPSDLTAERQIYGVLAAHGAAVYPHKKDGERSSKSYFAKLRNAKGNEFDVWGIDIERALEEGGVQVGQKICLTKFAKSKVMVVETITRPDGSKESVEKQVLKNLWSAKSVK